MLNQELAKDDMKSTFQLKADFETQQCQKELEDEFFRRTTEMREEAGLDHIKVRDTFHGEVPTDIM